MSVYELKYHQELADRLSRDAVLFADRMNKAQATGEIFDVGDRKGQVIGNVKAWVLARTTMIGSEHQISSPNGNANRTYTFSDGMRQARHSGMSFIDGLAYAASVSAAEKACIFVSSRGSIGLVVAQESLTMSTLATNGLHNIDMSIFVAPELLASQEGCDQAHQQWQEDIAETEAFYQARQTRSI